MINQYQPQVGQPNIFRPVTNIQYVQGETGAKGYPVTSGYTMMLMDSEQPRFYIKSVDPSGIPTMKAFKFEEIVEPEPEKAEYITKADFDAFKEEIKALLAPAPAPKSKSKAGDTDG